MIKRVGKIEGAGLLELWKEVYDSDGDAPCVTAYLGAGGNSIKIEEKEMIKIEGMIEQETWYKQHRRVVSAEGDSPTLFADYNGEKCIKVLEEPQAMRLVRTEECKAKRRETHDVGMSFKEGKYAEPKDDGILGTLTTIEKDNYIAEPFTVASRGRGENNEQHLEVGSSEHTNALTTVEKDNYVAEPRVYDVYNRREIDPSRIGTLTTNSQTGQAGTFFVRNPGYRIRKLTEKECFRLMGVKDEDSERVHANQSKSSMYHLAGDSIVTACLMGLFGEMFGMDWQSKVKELQESISHESKHPTEIQ